MSESKPTGQMLRLLFWESTIKCNLNCAHCRRVDSEMDAHTDMTTEQAKVLIDQLAQLGQSQPFMPIIVFSGGEPLVRGDIFELIEHAGQRSVISALATNGTLVDADTADRIKDSAIQRVSISLDGATADIHDKLRMLDGSFDQAVVGIKNLADRKVPFQINITLTKNNAHQLEDIYELAKSLGAVAVHVFMLVPVGCGQSLAETDMLSPQEYEEMLLKVSALDSRGEIEMKVTCGPHYERVVRQQGLAKARSDAQVAGAGSTPGRGGHGRPSKGCLAGLGVIFVAHNGDVFPCGYLPVKCGNVLEEKLDKIWLGSGDLARMRDGGALEGKCGICGYRQVCGGCRARAYSVDGNYMAEEPFCAYIPPQATG